MSNPDVCDLPVGKVGIRKRPEFLTQNYELDDRLKKKKKNPISFFHFSEFPVVLNARKSENSVFWMWQKFTYDWDVLTGPQVKSYNVKKNIYIYIIVLLQWHLICQHKCFFDKYLMAFLSRLHHMILSRGGGFVKVVPFRLFTIGGGDKLPVCLLNRVDLPSTPMW